eukprot:scaffold69169_cov66-Phaeocystis_antarctica.AAC.5
MLIAQGRGMPCAQCLEVDQWQDQRRVVPRVKFVAELVTVAFKLVLETASFRVCDYLLVPRPILAAKREHLLQVAPEFCAPNHVATAYGPDLPFHAILQCLGLGYYLQALDETGNGFAICPLVTLVAKRLERGYGPVELPQVSFPLSLGLGSYSSGCGESFCIREEQLPLTQPTVQPSSCVEHCDRLPSHESQLCRRHPICGRRQRKRRLAKQLRQRFRQPLNGVPSNPLLPRAAIAVAESPLQLLRQGLVRVDCSPRPAPSSLSARESTAAARVWRMSASQLAAGVRSSPELRLLTICAGLEEQVDHVASLLRSLLCHCVVFDEREEPLEAAIYCHPLHKGRLRLALAFHSKACQSFGLILARAQGVNELLRATTPRRRSFSVRGTGNCSNRITDTILAASTNRACSPALAKSMSHSELRTSTKMLPQLRSPCWCMRRGL